VIGRYMSRSSRRAWDVVDRACGSARCELETSYVAMESRRSSKSQSARPHFGLPSRVLFVERAEKRLRDGTSAPSA
jgi:hypothetical protein